MPGQRQKAHKIGDVIQAVFGRLSSQEGRPAKEKISAMWPSLVGKDIAAHTRPVSFKSGRLIVNVEGSGWLYGVSMQKQDIMDKMNKQLQGDKIKDIQFRSGEIK